MKKLSRIAALLAASAMLFGFAACSDSDSSSSTPTPENQEKEQEKEPSASDIYAWTFADLKDMTIEGVVPAEKDGWPTTADALASLSVNATTFAKTADGSSGKTYKKSGTVTNLIQFSLKSDVEYPSTGKTGLTMKVNSLDESGVPVPYNAWSDAAASSTQSAIKDVASAGYIEGENDFLTVADVQGPFKVQVVYAANASSDKTDRKAYVKIGSNVTYDTQYSSSIPAAGSTLTATYSGTDSVSVAIGGVKTTGTRGFVRIYDVKITPIEGEVVKASSVTIAAAADAETLMQGKTLQFTSIVLPDGTADKSVTWSATDADGAEIDGVEISTGGLLSVASTVPADTQITVKATTADGSNKTSDAVVITVTAAPKTVTLFNYASDTASLTDATFTNLDSDFVTISEVSFVLENNTNVAWADNLPAVGSVDSKLKTAAGTTTNIGYHGATTGTNDDNKVAAVGDSIAKVSFTVTPKEGATVNLKAFSGFIRYAGSANYMAKVSIGTATYTSEAAVSDSNSNIKNVATIDYTPDSPLALSIATKITIQFVASNANSLALKKNQNLDVFNVELEFAD